MLRRFIVLVCVAGVSGTAGLWLGLLYAPAPGKETRQKLAAIFEDHEDTFDELFARSREALGNAVDAASRTLSAVDEPGRDQ